MSLPIFLGWDAREPLGYRVAEHSMKKNASRELIVRPLKLEVLLRSGFLWNVGCGYADVLDDASPSTEFSRTRFLVPFLQERGWALYTDCDVVALGDVAQLFQIARLNPSYAVMCVKHDALPTTGSKMDGRAQRAYPRKNWSSVMMVNCEHEAHDRLSLDMVNRWPRELLHRFAWLREEEIGALPQAWNWLVDVQPKPESPKLAHFTLGTPELGVASEYAKIWQQVASGLDDGE